MKSPITIRFVVPAGVEGESLQEFLLSRRLLSRSHLIKLKRERAIFLNGRFQYSSTKVMPGDQIHFYVEGDEEVEGILPQSHPLTILHEDEDILVVVKEAGICVHPTMLHPDHTLANYVLAHWQAQGERHRFRAVNRLDRDTSGILVVAKHRWSHQQLAEQQLNKKMHRLYWAWVMGTGLSAAGTIDAPIARMEDSIMLRHVSSSGQRAITHFRVVATYPQATWVECKLETGRTHQIRVHFQHEGYPLWGDDLYGGSRALIGRQALHAVELGFYHPRTGAWSLFQAPLPSDLQALQADLQQK